jgi:hypothetical protein
MTISDLTGVINAIQAVNRGITGVRKAPTVDAYPLKVDFPADAPIALTWPKGGPWKREQFGSKKRVDDVVSIYVYVAPIGTGMFPARVGETLTLLTRFRDTWFALDESGAPTALADPVNAGDWQVTVEWDGELPSDGGVGEVIIGDVKWTGFEIQLRVRSLW